MGCSGVANTDSCQLQPKGYSSCPAGWKQTTTAEALLLSLGRQPVRRSVHTIARLRLRPQNPAIANWVQTTARQRSVSLPNQKFVKAVSRLSDASLISIQSKNSSSHWDERRDHVLPAWLFAGSLPPINGTPSHSAKCPKNDEPTWCRCRCWKWIWVCFTGTQDQAGQFAHECWRRKCPYKAILPS